MKTFIALAAIATMAAAAASPTCAKEGEECPCTGSVRYGAGTTWTPYKFVGGTITCDNVNFTDPLKGTAKSCQCQPAAGDAANTKFMAALASPAEWKSFQADNKAAWKVSGTHRATRQAKVMAYFNAKTKAGSMGSANAAAQKAYTAAKGKSTAANADSDKAKKASDAAAKAASQAADVLKKAVALQKLRGAHYSGITGKAVAKAAKDKKDHAALVLAATGARDTAKTSAQTAATNAKNAASAAALAKKEMNDAKTALGKAQKKSNDAADKAGKSKAAAITAHNAFVGHAQGSYKTGNF